jgi:hypothetical protein
MEKDRKLFHLACTAKLFAKGIRILQQNRAKSILSWGGENFGNHWLGKTLAFRLFLCSPPRNLRGQQPGTPPRSCWPSFFACCSGASRCGIFPAQRRLAPVYQVYNSQRCC